MTIARALTNKLKASGIDRRGPGAIYAFAMDGHSATCLTEERLDEWFCSLSAEHKAEIYERDLEGLTDELQFHAGGIARGSLASIVDRIDGPPAKPVEVSHG